MKALAFVLGAILALGPAGVALAQSTGADSKPPASAPSAPDSAAKSGGAPSASGDVKPENPSAPPSASKPDVNVNVGKGDAADRGGEGSALPRSVVTERTIFGLSPTAAAIIGAALLIVVILALVAMSRGGDQIYRDPGRHI